MSWKYLLGRAGNTLREAVLRQPWFPLTNVFPWGIVWPYDVMRFAGTRHLETLVDVGANVGQTALLLHRFFPQATIHSFEPIPATFARLRTQVAHIAQVHPHAIALGAATGSGRMTDEANSELNTAVRTDGAGATCDVTLQTLDSFCEQRAIAQIDILKIDVEGYEMPVLEGATTLLQSGRIRSVYIEVAFEPSDPTHTLFDLVRSHLAARGFAFSGLYEPWRYPESRGRIGFANALFWRL